MCAASWFRQAFRKLQYLICYSHFSIIFVYLKKYISRFSIYHLEAGFPCRKTNFPTKNKLLEEEKNCIIDKYLPKNKCQLVFGCLLRSSSTYCKISLKGIYCLASDIINTYLYKSNIDNTRECVMSHRKCVIENQRWEELE